MGDGIEAMELIRNRGGVRYDEVRKKQRLSEGGGKYLLGEVAERVLGISGSELEKMCNLIYHDMSPILVCGGQSYLPREQAVVVAGYTLSIASKISNGLLRVRGNEEREIAKKLMQNLENQKVDMELFR